MSQPIRFVMLGGFLGAGKTTTLARLARHYQSQGKNVVIVTNDQADHLVDTHLLRNQGFDVGEVAGSCFCCNFDGLVGQMESLSQAHRPDVILAEPVGSCTDLIATIAVPMMQLLGESFEVAPYAVLLKPSHGQKILSGVGQRGFSPNAEYIFRKQLEEADVVVINRIDELDPSQRQLLETNVEKNFPERPIVAMSAKTGDGLDDLIRHIEQPAPKHNLFMEVDYDVYADGEAELGWLNATTSWQHSEPIDLDQTLTAVLNDLKDQFAAADAEVAHVKAIVQTESDSAVANLVSNDSDVALSMPTGGLAATSFRMVVNARVAIAPETLESIVQRSLKQVADQTGAQLIVESIQSFRPGRPVPTHRATSS
ncbi:GTP-binding protein [Crateriforma spongiae]|uniref:GTP-binding protein n=1 Tax=Crateriforma spongiae TaxID=2724528 RepID=UPI001446A256|nr:GTP-binding protein [Crateriforma spongiae]